MIVSLCGTPGAGKSTVARIVAKEMGYNFYSIGDLRGRMAMKRGINIDELNNIGMTQDWTDKEVDEYQRELGESEDNFVIDGLISFYFIPHSKKILLKTSYEEGAKRIFNDQRPDEPYKKTVGEVKEMIESRMRSNFDRYKKYYGLENIFDEKNFDLVVDTTHKSKDEVCKEVLTYLKL